MRTLQCIVRQTMTKHCHTMTTPTSVDPTACSRLALFCMLCCLCVSWISFVVFPCVYRWSAELEAIALPEPGIMTNLLPLVHFKPQQAIERSKSTSYSCPLYQTSARAGTLSSTGQSTNFVLHLDLHIPANTVPADWILHGVAAICSGNQ